MKKSRHGHAPSDMLDHSDELGLEGLIFFSDAVFATAITLLALEIRLLAGEDLMDAARYLC